MRKQLKPGRYTLSREQVFQLVAGAKSDQDKLLISVMGFAGLRREESTAIKFGDVSERQTLRVIGKGNKLREIPLEKFLYKQIRDFINKRLKYIPANRDEFLFPSRRDYKKHIGNTMANRIVSDAGKKAHLKNPMPGRVNINPHILRHSYAYYLKSKNVNLEIIRDLLGHSSILTTMDQYGLASLDDMTEIINTLN